MTWSAVLGHWSILEYTWHATFGERLSVAWPALTWREFRVYLSGLLSDDNLLAAQFQTPPPTPTPKPEGAP